MDQSRRKEKGDLEEDSYKILIQFYKERKEILFNRADRVVACNMKNEKKILHRHNLVFFRQFCKIFYDY